MQSVRLLGPTYAKNPEVRRYAIESLLQHCDADLVLFLPQLVQLCLTDTEGLIRKLFRTLCESSDLFCHQLLWALQAETGGETGGRAGAATTSGRLAADIEKGLSTQRKNFWKTESDFIVDVLSLSAELTPTPKEKRTEELRQRLRDPKFHEPLARQRVYLPTDPRFRIADTIPTTGAAMQSAAKCPVLVQFTCTPWEAEGDGNAEEHRVEASQSPTVVKACIFKVGDDCRQDQLTLQLIEVFRRIFDTAAIPSYLHPYRVIPTGQGSGIIECVPESTNRSQISKLVESGLVEYFVQAFGHPESSGFQRARENFVHSMASYAVVSFVLNIKDRHNANLMIDAAGHLIHIDFGFLFDTSPGGDINFESSPFKLTAEMVQLMGLPMANSAEFARSTSLAKAVISPQSYRLFQQLTVQCYLAVRQYTTQLITLVEAMLGSGYPCFKPQKTIANLSYRLAVGKTEAEAAAFMLERIEESRENLRTILYDQFQKRSQGIKM